MKMISIFLAAIIISLTFQPCCSSEDKCNEESTTCSSDVSNATENEEPELPCSPFYSCGACPGFNLVTLEFITPVSPVNETILLNSVYHPGSSETYTLSLLKPPKQI